MISAFPCAVTPAADFHHDHAVQFYTDDAFLTNDIQDFVGAALSSGGSAIVVGTNAHNEVILGKLKNNGLKIEEFIARGQYQPLEASEVLSRFLIEGKLDELRFYETIGAVIAKGIASACQSNKRVVAFGEMVALLWAEGKKEEAIQLEKLWNGLARSYSFTLHCAYPMKGFCGEEDADSFLRICAEHTLVIPEEKNMASGRKSEYREDAVHPKELCQATYAETEWGGREQQFRLLVDQVQDYAIFMLDPEGRVRTWNNGAERIKGYKPSEVIGQHFSRFYTEEDVAAGKPQRLLRLAVEQGRVEDEGWRVRKSGEKFWARITLTPIRDEGGTLIGFGKVARDLTDRKRTEDILHRQEERFRLFVGAVQEYALFMLDTDGHIATWNTGAERIKGYKASEIIGKHFSVFYSEEDVRSGKPEWELKEAAKEGRIEDDGWRVRKDGSEFWANVVITAIRDTEGNLIGFGKVTRDLTERMLAQKSLEESQQRLYQSEKSLRELSLHLLRTQDEERRRIGREIHDSLGQYLSVLKMKVDSISPDVEEAAECGSLIDECVREVRTISYLLYPPMLEEMGVADGRSVVFGWLLKTKWDRDNIFGSGRFPATLS
ncbi:MAG: PAS domain S-box protein [Candidatus Acidiferrales bacterium]